MGLFNQFHETGDDIRVVAAGQPKRVLVAMQKVHDPPLQLPRIAHHATAEAEADDRKVGVPVPMRMDRQAPEQGLVTDEEFAQGVE
jgi:hypothetical protein